MFKVYLLTNSIINFFFQKYKFFLIKKSFFIHRYFIMSNKKKYKRKTKIAKRYRKKRKQKEPLHVKSLKIKIKKMSKSKNFKKKNFPFKNTLFFLNKHLKFRPFYKKIYFFKTSKFKTSKFKRLKFKRLKFKRLKIRHSIRIKKKKFLKRFKYKIFKNKFFRRIRRLYTYKCYLKQTINIYKPLYNLKKNLKTAFFSAAKFKLNLVKYILPNLVAFQDKFKTLVYESPEQKKLIKKHGKKILKKRYQFRRIFRKRFYMRKFFIAFNYRNLNPYKKLRLINFNYNDYKVYNFFKKNFFYQSFFLKQKIYLPIKYSNKNLKVLKLTNLFNYNTFFWKY